MLPPTSRVGELDVEAGRLRRRLVVPLEDDDPL
jgi:hypothetical protein